MTKRIEERAEEKGKKKTSAPRVQSGEHLGLAWTEVQMVGGTGTAAVGGCLGGNLRGFF